MNTLLYKFGFMVLMCISLSSILLLSCNEDGLTERVNKPNIIIIYADDVGYGDIGVYGSVQDSAHPGKTEPVQPIPTGSPRIFAEMQGGGFLLMVRKFNPL